MTMSPEGTRSPFDVLSTKMRVGIAELARKTGQLEKGPYRTYLSLIHQALLDQYLGFSTSVVRVQVNKPTEGQFPKYVEIGANAEQPDSIEFRVIEGEELLLKGTADDIIDHFSENFIPLTRPTIEISKNDFL
ncbi:MAG: hypothetical protein R3313_01300 [Candidatus Saccharimonadales bacterium]|nr:hypothetical protein [Candidatus Saccharimonadales bacterium]